MANAVQTHPPYNKDNPFLALITENRLLNKPGSTKDTRHFVVNIEGSGMRYAAGDSLGVYPTNAQEVVRDVLERLGFDGSEPVVLPKMEESIPLEEALTHRLALAGPTKKFLQALSERVGDEREKSRLDELLKPEGRAEMQQYLQNRECIDLLEEFPSAAFSPQEFVEQLKRLVPRLYSIASSPVVYPEEIHLTVAVVRYTTNERKRLGVCSTYLAERVSLHEERVPVFIVSSHFGLPEDDTKDVIMIGPGTGVAPFRAFIQERAALNSPGRSWLFFGDQHGEYDYLYGEECEDYFLNGKLHRIDLAFSRDQKEKVYVQHRMKEKAEELWKWIKGGACFCVCGDAKRMAKDVDAALHEIIAEQGGLSSEEAADYVKLMKKEKRYQRDVY